MTEANQSEKSKSETDDVEKEMEEARNHADPARGDKVVDGGDRVSTEKGGNPQE